MTSTSRPQPEPHPIAVRLAEIRRDLGLSQAQVALRLYVIQKTISHRAPTLRPR